MAGKTVVLDSNNLEAIIADATGEGIETPTDVQPPSTAEGAKDAPVAAKDTPQESAERTEDSADDVEGEDGLTPRQKRDLTQKMQTAIGKKHRALKDAEEFAAEQYNEKRLAEQRAEAQQREIDRLKQQLQGNKPAETDKPKRDNFETQEAFDDALTDWKVDQKFKEREAAAAKAHMDQIMANAQASVARALELVPDYEEKTAAADYIVPGQVAGLMQESPLFAELGYHFAEHPEELARLAITPPERLKVEFRKIESTVQPFAATPKATAKVENGQDASPTPSQNGAKPSTETVVTPPSKPRAAAPITPLSSGSAVQVEKPEREMTAQEAMADWQRKRQVNLTRRQRH